MTAPVIASTPLVIEARAWAAKLGRGRTADLLNGLCDALERQAPRPTTADIPAGYLHACADLERLGDRLGTADRSHCYVGALFIKELAAEVFQGIQGPA